MSKFITGAVVVAAGFPLAACGVAAIPSAREREPLPGVSPAPRPPITETPLAKVITPTRAQEKPTPISTTKPTPERGRRVPIEFSKGLIEQIPLEARELVQQDVAKFLSFSICESETINIVRIDEEDPSLPSQISLDIAEIMKIQESTGVSNHLYLRSLIIQSIMVACRKPNVTSSSIDIGGGFTLKTRPGFDVVFVAPDGTGDYRQEYTIAATGAMVTYITQEGFASNIPENTKMAYLIQRLIQTPEDAKELSDLFYRGNFSGFVAWIRRLSPLQVKKEDTIAVLNWFASAFLAQSQDELDKVVNEMLEKRGRPLNEKYNFNPKSPFFKAETVLLETKPEEDVNHLNVSVADALAIEMFNFGSFEEMNKAFAAYVEYAGTPSRRINVSLAQLPDEVPFNLLMETGTIVIDRDNLKQWVSERNLSLSNTLVELILIGSQFLAEEKLVQNPEEIDLGNGYRARQMIGLTVSLEKEGSEIQPTPFYQVDNIVSTFLAKTIKSESNLGQYQGLNEDIKRATAIVDVLASQDLAQGKFSSLEEVAQRLSEMMRKGKLKEFVAWVRGIDKKNVSNMDKAMVYTWFIAALEAKTDSQIQSIINQMISTRGHGFNEKTNFRIAPEKNPILILFDTLLKNIPLKTTGRNDAVISRNELVLKLLKKYYKDTRDEDTLKLINTFREKIKVQKESREKAKQEAKRNKHKLTMENFARVGAVV
mgnify:CR=1 FL=1